ncbi:MAG: peptidylprolyl isomerase [Vicinamibacterales bacterium]
MRGIATAAAVMVMTAAAVASARPAARTQKPAPAKPATAPARPEPFRTALTLDAMRGKQAVVTTTAGEIVIDLLPEHAPNHVGLFIKTAEEGGFTGTTFHRVVHQGIVQGGDPLTKDPATRAKAGTGGLNLIQQEGLTEKHTRGAVSAVIVPGRPDSGGTQFFICIVDQPSLDGRHTVYGRVSDGLLVAQRISEGAADPTGVPNDPVTITGVVIRDKPAERPTPFTTESVAELAGYRAVLETSLGDITVSLTPDKAPEHVRNFLRLAELGVYDDMTFHRVVKGFVIQTGHLPTRRTPLSEAQQKHVHTLKAEFNDQRHVLGTLSMARLAEPDTASTSFFIVTAPATMLDDKYTVFGKVEQGLDVVQAIEAVAVNGETPVQDVALRRIRLVKP